MPPTWAALEEAAALVAAELTAELAPELPTAELAADEASELAAALVAALVVDVEGVEVPVQLDKSGTAAALATPAPSNRSMLRRFIAFRPSMASKSEPVTNDLQISADRLSIREEVNKTFQRAMLKSTVTHVTGG